MDRRHPGQLLLAFQFKGQEKACNRNCKQTSGVTWFSTATPEKLLSPLSFTAPFRFHKKKILPTMALFSCAV